jgi:hypothetical protein
VNPTRTLQPLEGPSTAHLRSGNVFGAGSSSHGQVEPVRCEPAPFLLTFLSLYDIILVSVFQTWYKQFGMKQFMFQKSMLIYYPIPVANLTSNHFDLTPGTVPSSPCKNSFSFTADSGKLILAKKTVYAS